MIVICVSILCKPSILLVDTNLTPLSLTVPSGPPLMFNATAQSSQNIILVWAYGKAGNGNEMETGNGNWKWKLETEMGRKTHQSLV